jgi:hypothetical protein
MRSCIPNQWWDFENRKRKMHWRSWSWLTTPKFLGGMGFRDFVIFNQAMLGKQCWCLLTDPSSLCARVLKGRYFPSSDFLSATKPKAASFTWRSILFGRDLLVRGIRWGVGNGEKIDIVSDNWVPGFPVGSFKPLTPIPANTKVKFLLSDHGVSWDESKVRSFFHNELADTILQIPISRHGGEDFVSWPHDKYGIYSVRSAYNLARTAAFHASRASAGQGAHSDGLTEAKRWKSLWAIQAPGACGGACGKTGATACKRPWIPEGGSDLGLPFTGSAFELSSSRQIPGGHGDQRYQSSGDRFRDL